MSTDAKAKKGAKRLDVGAERQKRMVKAALNEALAKKRCGGCATVGAWEVYSLERTAGRTRYVRCLACGHCDQVPIILKENSDETDGSQASHDAASAT